MKKEATKLMPSDSPALSKHFDGSMSKSIKENGILPWCVLDAIGDLPGLEAGEGCENLTYQESCDRWFKRTGEKSPESGVRCVKCAFQGKPGTGAYPNCGISWMHDKDNGCKMFFGRDSDFVRERSKTGDGHIPPPYWWELNHEVYTLSGLTHKERVRRFKEYLQGKRELSSGQLELFKGI